MPEKKRIRLEFPFGGRNDRLSHQAQPPFTTPRARNVWPDAEPLSRGGRQRGGCRPGFAKAFSQVVDSKIIGLGSVSYVPDTSSAIRTDILAIGSSGQCYKYRVGASATLVGTLAVKSTQLLTMCERNQKLYIAGHSEVQSESEDTYRLMEYDPVAGTVSTVVATAGNTPRGCPCICTWRDRIVLGGGTTTPYGLFMSRQGDPFDWDYFEEDPSAAVFLGVSDRAGIIGETVTSLTPHADNCLIIGCPTSLWMLQGDPRDGGALVNFSREIGVVDRHAWCTTPDGLFVFLSHDGLYMVPAGCASSGNPISISRERLPDELLNTDRSTSGTVAVLAYDVKHRGIHIWLSARSTTTSTVPGDLHYFFDWEQKSFFEVQYTSGSFDPWAAIGLRNDYTSGLYAGCRDGAIRSYGAGNAVLDDGSGIGSNTPQPIDSYVAFGPLNDEPEFSTDVRLDQLEAALSMTSEDVRWSVFRGNSNEEALHNFDHGAAACEGLFTSGRSNRAYPRVRGPSLFVKLASSATWAFEAMSGVLSKLGKTRV